jgi:NAD(P)-dependent dehydrogenase (short-subunit alcohol dehydrogenase family)
MIKGLAVELARHRIRSNALIVGWADTEMNQPFTDRPGAVDAVISRSPLRRFLEPGELGPAAVFLADPTLVAHTGDVVTVDGAYHLA